MTEDERQLVKALVLYVLVPFMVVMSAVDYVTAGWWGFVDTWAGLAIALVLLAWTAWVVSRLDP